MTLFFLATRFSSKLWRRSLSKTVVPLLMAAHHVARSRATFCHSSVGTEVFSDAISVRTQLLLATYVSLSLAQLGKEELLWQAIDFLEFHACNVPSPAKLSFVEVGFNDKDFCATADFLIWYQTHKIFRRQVEFLQLHFVTPVTGSCLTPI